MENAIKSEKSGKHMLVAVIRKYSSPKYNEVAKIVVNWKWRTSAFFSFFLFSLIVSYENYRKIKEEEEAEEINM